MKNYKIIKNSNGLTLVELLVAIVILSIVLLTSMSIFSQAMKFSRITEENLVAINFAEKVLSEIKNGSSDYEKPLNLNGKVYNPKVGFAPKNKLGLEQVSVKIFLYEDKITSEKLVTEIFGYRD